jgi:hypothetical protein
MSYKKTSISIIRITCSRRKNEHCLRTLNTGDAASCPLPQTQFLPETPYFLLSLFRPKSTEQRIVIFFETLCILWWRTGRSSGHGPCKWKNHKWVKAPLPSDGRRCEVKGQEPEMFRTSYCVLRVQTGAYLMGFAGWESPSSSGLELSAATTVPWRLVQCGPRTVACPSYSQLSTRAFAVSTGLIICSIFEMPSYILFSGSEAYIAMLRLRIRGGTLSFPYTPSLSVA